jgi:NodT family efflux transporter outer membrane factor (OMF) lipoprotein
VSLSSSRPARLAIRAAPLLCGLLAGCVVGPNYHTPTAVPTAPAFKELPPPPPANGEWKSAQPSDAALKGKWWELYGDPELNALEEKVLVSNQSLKVAVEQYLQSREQVRVARAAYYPTVGIGPAASRTRESYNQPNTNRQLTTYQYNAFSIEGQASWEPDLWGQVRRIVEQAHANEQASAAALANIQLSLQSELATDYFELRGLDSQKRLLDRTVNADADFLRLTQIRFHGGVSTEVDVDQAQTQLQTVTTQDLDIGVARSQYEHAIATLTGVSASLFSLPARPLTLALPVIPVSLPAELLERRPDVAEAERRVEAANAQIGIAIAAFYPNVQLIGDGGLESTRVTTLFQGPSALWSLGASAMEILFDAGRRHALTEQARESYESQVGNYRESVLNAFQEVEDNLAALRILDQETVTQAGAVNAARRSLVVSTNRYKGGVTTYLEVLTAQTTQLANERTQTDIVTRQFTASVQLVKALGGGWNRSQLP